MSWSKGNARAISISSWGPIAPSLSRWAGRCAKQPTSMASNETNLAEDGCFWPGQNGYMDATCQVLKIQVGTAQPCLLVGWLRHVQLFTRCNQIMAMAAHSCCLRPVASMPCLELTQEWFREVWIKNKQPPHLQKPSDIGGPLSTSSQVSFKQHGRYGAQATDWRPSRASTVRCLQTGVQKWLWKRAIYDSPNSC